MQENYIILYHATIDEITIWPKRMRHQMSKMKLNKKTMAYRSRFMKEFLNTAREDKATTQNCPVLNEKSGEGTLTCCVGTSATTWEMSFIHALNKKCKFAK